MNFVRIIAVMTLIFFLGIRDLSAGLLAKSENRSLFLWGQNVDYRLITQKRKNVKFDGEAFLKKEKGQMVPVVVLNPVFFQKEAEEIFEAFEKNPEKSQGGLAFSFPELKAAERELIENSENIPDLSASALAVLQDLQKALVERAWRPLFQEATRESAGSREEALQRFVAEFARVRLTTIERHEVSHLLDLTRSTDFESEDFARFTELNAFFTELAYGSNPHDVMAQALAGLLDELRRGRPVDYSAAKVAAVLKFLRDCPQRGKFSSGHPLASPCLNQLAKIHQEEWIVAGKSLYRPLAPPSRLAQAAVR